MRIFILLAFLTNSALAQTWDSTARPDIYPVKVAMFKAGAHTKKDIVFLGNSITFWADWPELLHMRNIRNRGIPGDNTFGVLERLDEVISGQPAKVFILIGINDIAKTFPDSVILGNYHRIIQRLKQGSPRTKIYFQTLLPTNSSFGKLKAYYQPDKITRINAAIKQLGVEVIDLYPHFADEKGELRADLSYDGVHMKKAGYDIWVTILRNGKFLQ